MALGRFAFPYQVREIGMARMGEMVTWCDEHFEGKTWDVELNAMAYLSDSTVTFVMFDDGDAALFKLRWG